MKKGFSLVELSIVLVILGLLVGGVLAGQSLIRASELRAVTSEHARYLTALQAFRDKYFALPGDMPNATAFWGAAHNNYANCVQLTTASTGTATCNGDADGGIGEVTGAGNPVRYYETHRAWQHLANAGLIEGSYAGIGGTASTFHSYTYTAGYNAPASKIAGAVWTVANFPTYNNLFSFGGQNAYYGVEAILMPEEAWNIDTKTDDGVPTTGNTLGVYPATCLTGAAYNLTVKTLSCALLFRGTF